jgi:hypothetical protein
LRAVGTCRIITIGITARTSFRVLELVSSAATSAGRRWVMIQSPQSLPGGALF